MSFSATSTSTYTVADVAKVVDRFAADLGMAGDSTGLLTSSKVADYAADVKLLAQRAYIDRVDIVLEDAAGEPVRVAKYETSTDAGFWSVDRPGDMLWSKNQGNLRVIVHYTDSWGDLNDQARQSVRNECRVDWSPSKVDTAYPGMIGRTGRRYASNAYGMERTDLEAY